MNAIILSIGDELVLGQTVDTNSAWISKQLAAVGCDIVAHMTVGDDQPAIEQAIAESVGRCDFLVISGGLGPTEDDLTRQAIAAMMKTDLVLSDEWLTTMQGFFDKIGRKMPESNKIQAMIPRGAKMVFNTCGTAAGIEATYQSGDQKTTCHLFAMPGVPKEMKAMFTRDLLPQIEKRGGGAAIRSRTLHTFGLGESTVAERLGELMRRGRNPSVGTTVSGGVVSLRVNARFESVDRAVRELQQTVQGCYAALGDLIYGEDDETLPAVIAKQLTERSLTIATAESCTGGLLAKYLTDISGSSVYFKQGAVTYTNESKTQQLGVPAAMIQEHGAVSEPVARSMAESVRKLAAATYGVGISGIAGPTGGTPDKPVGTVCIGLAAPDTSLVRTFMFPGDREMIRDRAAKMAMTLVRFHLLKKRLPF